jgi:hypothetical protein
MKLRHDKFLPLFTNKLTHESLNRVHHRSLNGQNIAHFLWNLHSRAQACTNTGCQVALAIKVCTVVA